MSEQKFTIIGTNPVIFMQEVIQAVNDGARMCDKSYVYLNNIPYRINMIREITDESDAVKVSPTIQVQHTNDAIKKPLKELEEMDIDTLRAYLKPFNIKGKQKDVMIAKYLELFDTEVSETTKDDE